MGDGRGIAAVATAAANPFSQNTLLAIIMKCGTWCAALDTDEHQQQIGMRVKDDDNAVVYYGGRMRGDLFFGVHEEEEEQKTVKAP